VSAFVAAGAVALLAAPVVGLGLAQAHGPGWVDWEWTYDVDCTRVQATYPRDVTVSMLATIENADTGESLVLSYHPVPEITAHAGDVYSLVYADNWKWPGWDTFTVTSVSVSGAIYKSPGPMTCGGSPTPHTTPTPTPTPTSGGTPTPTPSVTPTPTPSGTPTPTQFSTPSPTPTPTPTVSASVTPSPSESRPLVPGDIGAVCVSEVPYLAYSVDVPSGYVPPTANPLTVTFVNPDGDDYVVTDLPLTGALLWPGASATEPLQWPGWELLPDGTYIETTLRLPNRASR